MTGGLSAVSSSPPPDRNHSQLPAPLAFPPSVPLPILAELFRYCSAKTSCPNQSACTSSPPLASRSGAQVRRSPNNIASLSRRSSVSTNVSHPGPQRQASGSFFSSSPQTVSPRASNAAGEGHDDELADGVSASLQQPRARRPTISTDYASLAVGGENSSSLLTSPNSPAIMSPGGRTVNRGPARARSRTIQSIFETPTSPSSSGPSGGLFFQSPMMADPAPLAEYAPPDAGGDASPQMDSRPRSASNASATGRTPRAHRPAASAAAAVVQEEQQEKGRRRSTSVTSSAEVDIVLPSDRPGGTRGWMETLLTQQEDRAEKRSSRAVSQSAGAPDEILAEEHPAEQGDTHHADVVNHLDVIGESLLPWFLS